MSFVNRYAHIIEAKQFTGDYYKHNIWTPYNSLIEQSLLLFKSLDNQSLHNQVLVENKLILVSIAYFSVLYQLCLYMYIMLSDAHPM